MNWFLNSPNIAIISYSAFCQRRRIHCNNCNTYISPLAKSIVTYYRNISRIKKPIKFILSHAHHAHVLLFMPIILTPLIPSQWSIEPQVTVHFFFSWYFGLATGSIYSHLVQKLIFKCWTLCDKLRYDICYLYINMCAFIRHNLRLINIGLCYHKPELQIIIL